MMLAFMAGPTMHMGHQVAYLFMFIMPYEFNMYFCACRTFYLILCTIVPGFFSSLRRNYFTRAAATMASSGFGSYCGL